MNRERHYTRHGKGIRNTTVAIAQKMLNRGRPIDEIMEDTGLSREEVEKLQN